MSIPRKAYSVPEVAHALGVSRQTVDRLIAAGELRAIKTGPGRTSRVLIPVAAVDDYLTRQAVQS